MEGQGDQQQQASLFTLGESGNANKNQANQKVKTAAETA